MAGALSLVLAAASVLVGAAVAVGALRLRSVLDTALALATVALAEVVVATLLAGAAAHEFRRAGVLVASCAVSAAVALLSLLIAGERPRLPRPGLPPGAFARALARPWEAILVGLAVAELVWRGFVGAVVPPYGYDALWYHLTTVAGWMQSGQIGTHQLTVESSTYPANVELVVGWLSALVGSDALVGLVQLGFAVLGAAAVAGLATSFGLSRAGAAAAGALFFLTPIVIAQSTVGYVDVAFFSTFLGGLHFLVRFLQMQGRFGQPRLRFLLLGGFGVGFALGAKGTGPLYAGVIVLVLVVELVLAARRRQFGSAVAIRALAAFLVPLLLVGGFWYARNLVRFGNPTYPFEISVLGLQFVSGPQSVSRLESGGAPSLLQGEAWPLQVARSWGHDLTRLRPPFEYFVHDSPLGGFGVQWTLLALPLLAVLAFEALRRRRALQLSVLVPVALIFLLQPYKWWSRFTIVLAAAGVLALAFYAERWRGRLGGLLLRVASIVLVLASLWLATGKVPLGSGASISAIRLVRLAARPFHERSVGRVVCAEYAWVDNAPAGARIGVDRGYYQWFYPLYGRHFEHRVSALTASTRDAFLREARNEDFLFLPRTSVYSRWASAGPAFAPIYEDDWVRVFRSRSQAAGASTPLRGSTAGCTEPEAASPRYRQILQRVSPL